MPRQMISELHARIGAAVSNAVTWLAVGGITAHAQAAPDAIPQLVNEQSLNVSLPVFFVSIIATAGFTWTIARWDAARTKKVDRLEQEIRRLLDERDGGQRSRKDAGKCCRE